MKRIVVFGILLLLVHIANAFAFKSGIGIYAPLGMSISTVDQEYKLGQDLNDGKLTSANAFEWGVGILPGLYAGFDDYLGFSIALDIAYKREAFLFNETKAPTYQAHKSSHYFDTLQLGLLPKFNINRFFIGVGGGVKLLLAETEETTIYNPTYSQFENVTSYYNTSAIEKRYKSIVVPYVKLTMDYLFYLTSEAAFGVGVYASYDFGPKIVNDNRFNKLNYGAVDLGAQLSFYLVDD